MDYFSPVLCASVCIPPFPTIHNKPNAQSYQHRLYRTAITISTSFGKYSLATAPAFGILLNALGQVVHFGDVENLALQTGPVLAQYVLVSVVIFMWVGFQPCA